MVRFRHYGLQYSARLINIGVLAPLVHGRIFGKLKHYGKLEVGLSQQTTPIPEHEAPCMQEHIPFSFALDPASFQEEGELQATRVGRFRAVVAVVVVVAQQQ